MIGYENEKATVHPRRSQSDFVANGEYNERTMDCRSFFQRQRAILFAPLSGSSATIGQKCTIIDIDPDSKLRHPHDATHWRVRIFLPHVPEYREVYARDLLGLQERDDSPLPPPGECRQNPHAPLSTRSVKWAEPPPLSFPRTTPFNVAAAAAILWGMMLVAPPIALFLALVTLLVFLGTIAWSAVRHREHGWWAGLLFCAMIVTLPLWVTGANWLFQWLEG